jgi:hypothetical protein
VRYFCGQLLWFNVFAKFKIDWLTNYSMVLGLFQKMSSGLVRFLLGARAG